MNYFSTFPSPATRQLARHLTFLDIDRIGITCRTGQVMAEYMLHLKARRDFHEEALPIEQLLGTRDMSYFYNLLLRVQNIAEVICLNFTKVLIETSLLNKIFSLCPKIKRLRFNTATEMHTDLVKSISSISTLSRLEIPASVLDHLLEENFLVYGVTLRPKDNQELHQQIKKLKKYFPDATTIRIVSTNITALPKLPNTITHLTCSDCPIKTVHSFPKKLEYFDGRNCPITAFPKYPKSLKTVLLH